MIKVLFFAQSQRHVFRAVRLIGQLVSSQSSS